MKIKELIELLNQYNPEKEIAFKYPGSFSELVIDQIVEPESKLFIEGKESDPHDVFNGVAGKIIIDLEKSYY